MTQFDAAADKSLQQLQTASTRPGAVQNGLTLPVRIQRIAQALLTWVETQEAGAVRFGIFEACTRGEEIAGHFDGRPIGEWMCSRADALHALAALRELGQIVVLYHDPTAPDAPASWTFRSRM